MVACRKDKAWEGTAWGWGADERQNSALFLGSSFCPLLSLASESRGLLQRPTGSTPTSQTGTQSPGMKPREDSDPETAARGPSRDLMPLGGWDTGPEAGDSEAVGPERIFWRAGRGWSG